MSMAHRNGFIWTADVAGRAVFAGRAAAGRTAAGRTLPPPSDAKPPATSRRR